MKITKSIFFLLFLLTMIACNGGKEESVNQVPNSEAMNVENAVTNLNNSIIDPTPINLERIVSDRLTYGHSSGKVQNKTEFIDDLVHGTFDFISIDISNQTVNISGDVAVVRHIFDSEATNAGETVHVHIGNVLIFQKKDGQWKLLARQAYKL